MVSEDGGNRTLARSREQTDAMGMWHRRTGLILVLLISLTSAACSGRSEAGHFFRQGEQAAADGRWTEAFTAYRETLRLEPDHEAAEAGLSAAVDRLLDETSQLPVFIQARLLERLESQDRQRDLRTVLDRSMVAVEAGWGVMGTADGPEDERPVRDVYLDAFWIDRFEITNLQYAAYLTATNRPAPSNWDDRRYPPGATLQ